METFHGKITSTTDALIIFEACRQGVLYRTTRRLREEEKNGLSAGSVYVYDEVESGIKRWTDGKNWSPSRIVGDFLVYQELEIRLPHVKRYDELDEKTKKRIEDENLRVHISNKGTFIHRKSGLSKKTIAVKLNGSFQHMVVYENKEVANNLLCSPRAFIELLNIEPGVDLTHNESLRKQKDVPNDVPTPKLNKIEEIGNFSPIASEKVIEQQRQRFSSIPSIKSASLSQNLPSITEVLYSPAPIQQGIFYVDIPDANHVSQGDNQLVKFQIPTNVKLEDQSQNSDLDLIAEGINIWQNNGYFFPAYTHRAAAIVRDTMIPDTTDPAELSSVEHPVNADYFGLVDYSRL